MLTDANFLALWRGKPLPLADAPPAIGDEEEPAAAVDVAAAEVEDLGAEVLVGDFAPLAAAAAPPGVFLGAALAGEAVAGPWAPVTYRGHKIFFNLDHGPHHVDRATIRCSNPMRDNCKRERSLALSPRLAGIYAYLIVWSESCWCDRGDHVSHWLALDQGAIDVWTAELVAEGF